MRTALRVRDESAIRNEGTFVHPREAKDTRKFGAVAKVIWPRKTAAELAYIAGTTERAAKFWLSGRRQPPAIVIAAIITEITKQ